MFADGRTVWGKGFGAEGEAVGELCFNTAMTGYQEVMTDPVLRQAGRRLHLPAHRQCRRQRRGRRGGRSACARLPGARGGDRAEQLPRQPGLCRLDGEVGADRDRRGRHARADQAGARRRGRRTIAIAHRADGQFDLEALQRRRRTGRARRHGPREGGQPASRSSAGRRQVGAGGRAMASSAARTRSRPARRRGRLRQQAQHLPHCWSRRARG